MIQVEQHQEHRAQEIKTRSILIVEGLLDSELLKRFLNRSS
jgi:hypothetical protein